MSEQEPFNGVDAVNEVCQEENLDPSRGGESGVKHLARLANIMGYRDPQYFGQFQGACYGDLIQMLEDNQGLCEKMVEWIQDNAELWDCFAGNQEDTDYSIQGATEYELDDGGCIEPPDQDGTIRRRDKDGNCQETRTPDENNWQDWYDLFKDI